MQRVVNEVPPRQTSLPVFRYLIVSTFRQYSVLISYDYLPKYGIAKSGDLKKYALSDDTDH